MIIPLRQDLKETKKKQSALFGKYCRKIAHYLASITCSTSMMVGHFKPHFIANGSR